MTELRQLIETQMPSTQAPARVDGWPDSTHVRLFSGREFNDLLTAQESYKGSGPDGADDDVMTVALIIATGICDPNGNRPFDPSKPADLQRLSQLPIQRLQAMSRRILEFNEIPDADGETKPLRPTNGSGTK